MRCAAHLAAILEFCGNGILSSSLDPSPDGPVRLVDVADAIGPEAGAVPNALSWLTATPLLRSLSDNRWQFATRGSRGSSPPATSRTGGSPRPASGACCSPAGLTRYVHPRHQDLAGWLAWHRPEVYSEILDHDPAPLLSPDLPAQSPAVRAQVVDALFTAAGAGRNAPAGRAAPRQPPGTPRPAGREITPPAAGKPAPQRSPWHWRWRSPEPARTRPRPGPCWTWQKTTRRRRHPDRRGGGVPRGGDRGCGSRLEALARAPAAQVARPRCWRCGRSTCQPRSFSPACQRSARVVLAADRAQAGCRRRDDRRRLDTAAVPGRHRELPGGSHAAADLGVLTPAAS